MLGAMDVFTEAVNLAQRYEKGDAFRFHVGSRLALVVPVLAVFLAISIALGLGLFPMMGTHRWGVLLAMVLVPFVLLGSFALQIYVFLSWLELRALEPMLAHGHAPARGPWIAKLRLGKPPPIPRIAAPILLFSSPTVPASAAFQAPILDVA